MIELILDLSAGGIDLQINGRNFATVQDCRDFAEVLFKPFLNEEALREMLRTVKVKFSCLPSSPPTHSPQS